jgi:hypothetical protein
MSDNELLRLILFFSGSTSFNRFTLIEGVTTPYAFDTPTSHTTSNSMALLGRHIALKLMER